MWTAPYVVSDTLYFPHLYAVVLDVATPGEVDPAQIMDIQVQEPDLLAQDSMRGASSPALAVAGGNVYLAWTVDAGHVTPGSAMLVLKKMPWTSGGLDTSLPEFPLPHDAERQQSPFQSSAVLGVAPWTSGGSLLLAWEDNDYTFGPAERRPDVVTQVMPLPMLRAEPADGGP